jgi:hypothetical protein
MIHSVAFSKPESLVEPESALFVERLQLAFPRYH